MDRSANSPSGFWWRKGVSLTMWTYVLKHPASSDYMLVIPTVQRLQGLIYKE